MLFNSKKSGFKLLSLLFVVGLTFAACSQDYDDQTAKLQDQINKEAAARSEAIAKLENQLEALQATHAADIQKLQDADAKLLQAVADAEKAAKDYADKVAAAEADAAEAAAKAYADAQDKVILATAEAAAAEAEANAKAYTEAQIAALKAQLENEIAAAKKELTEKYDAEIAALKTKDAELQKAIDDAKAKAEKDLADAVKKIEDAHKADINRIDAAVAAIDARVKDIEAWEATAKTQIAANETAIAALKGDLAKEIADREAADKALQTALNTLGSKVDANYNELNGKIQANYEELKKADDALYAAIVDNAKKIKDLQDADVALGKRIDGVVADLEQAKKAIEEQIKKICGDIDDLYTKYDALNKAFEAYKTAQAATDKAQDAALAAAKAELQKALADAKAAQAVTDAAQDAALAQAVKDVTAAYTKAIADAVKKVEGEFAAADKKLQEQIDALDKTVAQLNAAITVFAARPTTIVFKPYTFINGIEAFELKPLYYTAYANADNTDTTAVNGLVAGDEEFYVAVPTAIEYVVNPFSATVDEFNFKNVAFNIHGATETFTREGEGQQYLVVNNNHKPTIVNHTLKFYVDAPVNPKTGEAAWKTAVEDGEIAVFNLEIGLANEEGTVVSDYARLAENPSHSYFRISEKDNEVNPLYNGSKKAIYELDSLDAPVFVENVEDTVYQIKGFEVGAENPTLLSLVETAEFADENGEIVDATRWSDLGFEYRFYVPRNDKTSDANKSADEKDVYYMGPQYGPWGYAAAGTDFQKFVKSIDHKTGAIEFGEKAKGMTPIVLMQVVDPNQKFQVVTEAYVRLVVKGDEVKDAADVVTTYPNCEDSLIAIPYTAAQMKELVYDKFGVDQTQFEKYWDKNFTAPADTVAFDEEGNLVAYIPYSELKNLKTTELQKFETTFTATLGGNSVEIKFQAQVGLPTIELAYMQTYWESLPQASKHVPGVIVGNPRPISEENYTAYASYDFDLRDGYNTIGLGKAVDGFVYDSISGLQYKAMFNGENISEEIAKDGCLELNLFAVDFETVNGKDVFFYGDGSKKSYNALSKQYNSEFKAYNPANYVEAVQMNADVRVPAVPFNVQLTEKEIAPEINGPWGSQAAIKLLDDDVKVPAVVVCYYKYNDDYDERVIDEFMIDYEKPIKVVENQREKVITDAMHKVQSIDFNSLIKLEDWLGCEVAAYYVEAVPAKGDSSPKALAHYYNVSDPEWRLFKSGAYAVTDLEVAEDGILKANPALVEKFLNDGITEKNEGDFGPLPDGISLVEVTGEKKFNYNNVGGLVKEDYHMFLEAVLKHKWGEVPAKVVITVKANDKF